MHHVSLPIKDVTNMNLTWTGDAVLQPW